MSKWWFGLLLIATSAWAAPTKPTPPKPSAAQAPCPSVATNGSTNVLTEKKPAGRLGDGGCAVAVQGSSDVLINGRPALRVGDKVTCPNGKTGVVTGGASTVIINGKPAAGLGSKIVGCD
jgi:uncharacterized Zn-binding protein involved in type VI secretion